jgi:2-iminobutanoate/2-iminopropanoate deaminase
MAEIDRFAADPPGRVRSYSQAVRAGSLIITAGHLGAAPGESRGIEEQTRTALTQLLATVERAGGRADTILRINAYLATIDDFQAFDGVYREVIGLEKRPARTRVQIGGFKAPYLVEVDAIAAALDDASLA